MKTSLIDSGLERYVLLIYFSTHTLYIESHILSLTSVIEFFLDIHFEVFSTPDKSYLTASNYLFAELRDGSQPIWGVR